MKKKIVISVLMATFLAGCFGGGYGRHRGGGAYQSNSAYPASTTTAISTNLPSNVKNSLVYMYEEERLAKEVYEAIYQKQPVMQLQKIASRSETKHIEAVESMARRYSVPTYHQQAGVYSIPAIQSLYNTLYNKGIRSQKDALEVGCMVEVTDIEDLDRYIYDAKRAGASDILQTYEFLRRGSYNHYHAFDKGLKQIGIASGCCSLGQKYCHPEYPQNQRGSGHGQGRGNGLGRGQGRW